MGKIKSAKGQRGREEIVWVGSQGDLSAGNMGAETQRKAGGEPHNFGYVDVCSRLRGSKNEAVQRGRGEGAISLPSCCRRSALV